MPSRPSLFFLPPWAQCTLICLLCLLGFGQTLDFAFIDLDDYKYVLKNPWIAQGLSISSLTWAVSTFDNPYYMPLTRLSFLLDGSLYGTDPGGYHLSNLLLHTANSLLVFSWIRLLGFRRWIPLAVAGAFAVHPQHLEAVAWIAERKELLSACFGLLSLHCYVHFMSAAAESRLPPRGWLLLSLLCYLLSMLAKPMWVTLPLLLLVLDAWPLNAWTAGRRLALLRQKLPFLLLACAFILLHKATALGTAGYTVSSYGPEDWPVRLGHAMVAWATYLWQSLIPVGLSTYAPYPETPLPTWLMLTCTAAIVTVSVLVLLWRRGQPQLLAAWAWFSIGLAPAIGIGIMPLVGMNNVGEAILSGMRFTYMPHVLFFLGISVSLEKWSRRSGQHQRIASTAWVLFVTMLLLSTLREGEHWRDTEAFWLRSIAQSGEHPFNLSSLGHHYLDSGRPTLAIAMLERAQALDPVEPLFALALGNAYRDLGQMDEAYAHYARMLDEAPAPPVLLHMQALSFYVNGERQLAEVFRQAARQAGLTPQQEASNLARFSATQPTEDGLRPAGAP